MRTLSPDDIEKLKVAKHIGLHDGREFAVVAVRSRYVIVEKVSETQWSCGSASADTPCDAVAKGFTYSYSMPKYRTLAAACDAVLQRVAN